MHVGSREESMKQMDTAIRQLDPVLIAAPWLSDQTGRLSLSDGATRLAELYHLLFAPGQVIELRALGVTTGRGRPHIEAGFFDTDHLNDLARTAFTLSLRSKGVYYTLNPVNPDLHARCCNRVDWADEGTLTKDADIIGRRWLLVDFDPVRAAHISATDGEKSAALTMAYDVREWLSDRSWPEPILSDSGNGYHLLYRIDLPAADKGVVERILHALAKQHDTDRVKIDRKVFNPARICKLPGTWARKGDNTPTRPHRQSQILEVPVP